MDQSNQNQHPSDEQAKGQRGMESKKKNPAYKQPAQEYYQPKGESKNWNSDHMKNPGKYGGNNPGLYQSPQHSQGGMQSNGWGGPPPPPQTGGAYPQGGFQGRTNMYPQNNYGAAGQYPPNQNQASFQGSTGMPPSAGGQPTTLPYPTPGGQPNGFPGNGAFPRERSYIENILRLNRGKQATLYMTFENNDQWNAEVFRGIIREAGRDHIVIEDTQNGRWYLLLMIYLDYVVFDEPLEYNYPYA